MSDKTPPADETEEEKARRLKREALFEDVEDEPQDTLESLRAARDELLAANSRLTTSLANAQSDNLRFHNDVEEARAALRRAEAKYEQDRKFAVEKFVTEMLPVIDTLELGLKNIPAKDRGTDAKFDKLASGIEKTLGQLKAIFNKAGIREIDPLGEAFDESRHEAIAMLDKPDTAPETIIDVQQKGYEIEGRIIRPAKVIVTPPV